MLLSHTHHFWLPILPSAVID